MKQNEKEKPRLIDRYIGEGGLENPPTILFLPKAGRAVLVSLVSVKGERFRLVVSKGEILDKGDLDRCEMPYFFFRPDTGVKNCVEAWLKQGGIKLKDVFYQKTGIPECNGLCPVSKILWFLEEEPELYQKTAYFLLLENYIIYKLTGFIVTEKSLLCNTGYFNMQTDEVWTELLVRAGIDPEKIPPAMDCGKMVGELSEEAVKETGLCAGTKVVTGAMDQVCGALGAGNDKAGELTETTGTALCIGKTIKSGPIHTTYQIPVYRHYRKELQLLLPVCMTAGLALKWFKDTFCRFETEKAARAGRDIYDILSDMAETSPPLAKEII